MINTAEFWVGVSFAICVGISFKLIVPVVKSNLDMYQKSIEQMFLEAENVLVAAQKKFGAAKNQLEALPHITQTMTEDLNVEINQKLNEWKSQQSKILLKYQHMQEHKVQSLKNHSEAQIYSMITQAFLNLMGACFKQSFTYKLQQQMILSAIKELPKI
jgi:F0F1-type ATP synthase membrane subunit b/b'